MASFDKKKTAAISLVALTTILIIGIVFSIYERFSSSDSLQRPPNAPENVGGPTSNFPIQQNQVGSYSFSCKVTQTDEVNIPIQQGYTIEYLATCEYYDANLKTHTIKVPMIVSNDETRLAASRTYDLEAFSNWTTQDHLNNISRWHYIQRLSPEEKNLYDDPKVASYFSDPNAKKPILNAGDDILIHFVLSDSSLISNNELQEAHAFTEGYIESTIGYDTLEEFLQTGLHPESVTTESEQILFPSWTDFLKDNDV